MPLNLQTNLPAIELLKKEHISVTEPMRGTSQGFRPLRVVLLNLMPLKIMTETDLARMLSNTPLQIELVLMKIKGHVSKNTSSEHIQEFYKDLDEIGEQYFDGLIVTGAPVEKLAFEEVTYWDELTGIFQWARTHVTSTYYTCWAAQAALYHFFGIPKYELSAKMFGVFKHTINEPDLPIFRGFDTEFYVPHSRYTEIKREDIAKVPELKILSESKDSGVYMMMSRGGREFFITGHSEYPPNRLNDEYVRDIAKGLPIAKPANYYPNDDPSLPPSVRWRAHGNLLFNNWLNYYVYQETPLRPEDIGQMGELKKMTFAH